MVFFLNKSIFPFFRLSQFSFLSICPSSGWSTGRQSRQDYQLSQIFKRDFLEWILRTVLIEKKEVMRRSIHSPQHSDSGDWCPDMECPVKLPKFSILPKKTRKSRQFGKQLRILSQYSYFVKISAWIRQFSPKRVFRISFEKFTWDQKFLHRCHLWHLWQIPCLLVPLVVGEIDLGDFPLKKTVSSSATSTIHFTERFSKLLICLEQSMPGSIMPLAMLQAWLANTNTNNAMVISNSKTHFDPRASNIVRTIVSPWRPCVRHWQSSNAKVVFLSPTLKLRHSDTHEP